MVSGKGKDGRLTIFQRNGRVEVALDVIDVLRHEIQAQFTVGVQVVQETVGGFVAVVEGCVGWGSSIYGVDLPCS